MMEQQKKNMPNTGEKNNVNEIEEKAKKLLRIAGKWYKKALDPLTHQETLYPIAATMVIADEGKEIGNLILKEAPKYLAMTNIPSHVYYTEDVENGDGEMFYNIYRPLSHTPAEGSWEHVEMLLRHIFQDQYELGLDYIQILYENPLHELPILLLVSNETGTGKSTFCNVLQAVFCENALPLTPEIMESRFNSYYVGKLLGYIEEQADDSDDRRMQNAKNKNIVTAKSLPVERKGKDPYLARNFMKIVICSNDEETPVKIDANDTRHWVRKVPPLTREEEGHDILEECKKEIPAFLWFLLHRHLSTPRKNRLWFAPEQIQTDAWRRIVQCGKSSYEKSLVNLLLDIMKAYDRDVLRYSKTELNNIVRNAPQFSDRDRRKTSDIEIRDILRRWGLTASKKNIRHKVYSLAPDGGKTLVIDKSSNAYTITRELLLTMKI